METETYIAFGEAYALARRSTGWWLVTHVATGDHAGRAFGTRGYATYYCRTDAQRRTITRGNAT